MVCKGGCIGGVEENCDEKKEHKTYFVGLSACMYSYVMFGVKFVYGPFR